MYAHTHTHIHICRVGYYPWFQTSSEHLGTYSLLIWGAEGVLLEKKKDIKLII